MNKYSFLILRIAIGTSMFGHGLVRLPHLSSFSEKLVASFEKTFLPSALVLPFSYLLPVAELVTGLLLLFGLFIKQASILGSAIMILLIFGTCMLENWDALPSQLIHTLFFALVLNYLPSNSFALDLLMNRKRIK